MPDGPLFVTRFRAVDEEAGKQMAELLRRTATAVTSEPGNLSYHLFADQADPTTLYVLEAWASSGDAQRHADLVLGSGAIDRVLSLLRERLDTRTLVPMATTAPVGVPDGGAA